MISKKRKILEFLDKKTHQKKKTKGFVKELEVRTKGPTSALDLSPQWNIIMGDNLGNLTMVNLNYYRTKTFDPTFTTSTLSQHFQLFESAITSVRFCDQQRVLAGSADSTLLLFDLQKCCVSSSFQFHNGDVIDVQISPECTFTGMTIANDGKMCFFDLRVEGSTNPVLQIVDKRDNGHFTSCKYFEDGSTIVTVRSTTE